MNAHANDTTGHFSPRRRATVPTPLSAFKTGSPAPLPRENISPLPPFCGFRFCETGLLPLTHDRISDLWLSAPNGKWDRQKIPNISTTPRRTENGTGRKSKHFDHTPPNGKRDRKKIQTFRQHRANSHRILALATVSERRAPNDVERSDRECAA
ncbi:hypothetical protein AVEN_30321-1 [Araneus ventricosus]|uniref:Uncharacterized protein n=1 Tax=Araneus ventricosus TaxID=182803 RepID=A0A4Y2WAT1_ARAVE|nr:hypothetical protein AVEN_30321-1 [Araneus ventricosus]